VPVVELRHHEFEGVEHVEIGAGIEVGGGQGRSGMQKTELADSGLVLVLLPQDSFQLLRDIDALQLLVRFDGKTMHGLPILSA